MRPLQLRLVCVVFAASLAACDSDDESSGAGGSAGQPDAGGDASPDGPADDAATTSDAAEAGMDAWEDAHAPDAAEDAAQDTTLETGPTPDTEQEPNDGNTTDGYNELAIGVPMQGAIATPGDSDVFRVVAAAGRVLRVELSRPETSQLEPHVAVFDDGRGDDNPGEDYVKIGVGQQPVVELLSMDTGGYFVAVRDARNVDGQSVGGPDFGYELTATEHDTDGYEGDPLTFPSQVNDALSHPSGVRLYGFDGTAGSDIVVDLQAQGDMDGRLMIYADAIQSWIARNDDRSMQNTDPLIDAFLTEGGSMLLVVENVNEQATQLSYGLDASMP